MISVKHFFHAETFTLAYIVFDERTKDAVIIDPALDFDTASGRISHESSKQILEFLKNKNLSPHAVLETHAHADHLSSSQFYKKFFPQIKIAIGENIKIVQEVFKGVFNLPNLKTDASQFDLLLKNFTQYEFGSLKMKTIPSPGHTPACMCFHFDQHLFVGDALFMPDSGTGRCDFPKGSAKDLYRSITKNLYTLPDETIVYVGHDYSPNNRPTQFQTTIGESKKSNIQLKSDTSESDYVSFRETRDKTLSAPRLLLPSIQVNIDAGHLPVAENNGKQYLKLPLSVIE